MVDALATGPEAPNAPLGWGAGAWAIACSADQMCGVSRTTSSRRPSIFWLTPVRNASTLIAAPTWLPKAANMYPTPDTTR